jgi:pimeloyl-ACP methyl ester carboxylesterase
LPGFGNSQKPPESWGLDDYCDFVKNFVDFLNIKDFYLLGHSFGGGIAVKYCIKFPQDIKKVFFVSAAFIRRKTIKKWFLSRISKILKVFSFLPFFTIARKAFYKFVVGGDYQYSTGVMKESFSKVAGENLSEKISLINVPAVIIWGDKDDATLVQDAYFMKQKIKNSQLEIFEDMKHTPYLECPEKLAESIIKFINK